MKIQYRKNQNFFFLQFTFSFDFDATVRKELEKHVKKNGLSEVFSYDIVDVSLIEKDGMKYAVVGVAY